MYNSLIVSAALVFSINTFAVEKSVVYNDSQLEISYTKANCSNQLNGIEQENLLFQFVNKTNKELAVSFERKVVYKSAEGKEYSNSGEVPFLLTLSPNQSLSGKCETKDKSLKLFSKQLNLKASELKSAEIINVAIK